jgi:hypothetical protein
MSFQGEVDVFQFDKGSNRNGRYTSVAEPLENGTQTDDQPDPVSLQRLAHEAASRGLRKQIQEREREIERAKQEITRIKVSHERSVQQLMAKS